MVRQSPKCAKKTQHEFDLISIDFLLNPPVRFNSMWCGVWRPNGAHSMFVLLLLNSNDLVSPRDIFNTPLGWTFTLETVKWQPEIESGLWQFCIALGNHHHFLLLMYVCIFHFATRKHADWAHLLWAYDSIQTRICPSKNVFIKLKVTASIKGEWATNTTTLNNGFTNSFRIHSRKIFAKMRNVPKNRGARGKCVRLGQRLVEDWRLRHRRPVCILCLICRRIRGKLRHLRAAIYSRLAQPYPYVGHSHARNIIAYIISPTTWRTKPRQQQQEHTTKTTSEYAFVVMIAFGAPITINTTRRPPLLFYVIIYPPPKSHNTT